MELQDQHAFFMSGVYVDIDQTLSWDTSKASKPLSFWRSTEAYLCRNFTRNII